MLCRVLLLRFGLLARVLHAVVVVLSQWVRHTGLCGCVSVFVQCFASFGSGIEVFLAALLCC